MSFSRKTINTNTLGDFFKKKRQEKNLSLKEVEKETGVIKKFLQYIEEDNFHKIPGFVYAKGAVLKYADFLNLDKTKILSRFEKILKPNEKNPISPPNGKKNKPRFAFKTGIFTLIVIAIIAYLGLNIFQVLAMPEIEVISPKDNLITQDSSLLIKGKTEKGAQVFINNESIQANKDGSFQKNIELLSGVNTINISAKTRHSSKAEVIRQVLYREKNNLQKDVGLYDDLDNKENNKNTKK